MDRDSAAEGCPPFFSKPYFSKDTADLRVLRGRDVFAQREFAIVFSGEHECRRQQLRLPRPGPEHGN